MNSYSFFIVSIVILVLGVGLYQVRPLLDRWHQILTADIERMRMQGRLSQTSDVDRSTSVSNGHANQAET